MKVTIRDDIKVGDGATWDVFVPTKPVREQISQDAKTLAEDLHDVLAVDAIWRIIEDRLDLVRSDAHEAGRMDERARGPRDSIDY